jgi:prepilin-type N-terminal cleavage/methylation domain-containing protein
MRIQTGRERAFTLVEILMVVIILGIAGAIIIPQMGSRDDLKAAAAARVVMADLIYAQNLAITKQANHFLEFDLVNQRYTVMDAAKAAVDHPVNHTPFIESFGVGSSAMQSCRIDSAAFTGTSAQPRLYIGFDELGTPLAWEGTGSPETLVSGNTVIQSGQFKLRVDIEPYTGQISVTPVP